jgi:hypothetical protein
MRARARVAKAVLVLAGLGCPAVANADRGGVLASAVATRGGAPTVPLGLRASLAIGALLAPAPRLGLRALSMSVPALAVTGTATHLGALAPLTLQERVLGPLTRGGASYRLGAVEFGQTWRPLRFGSELRLDTDGPILASWIRFDSASRRVALPLPSLRIIPMHAGGAVGIEVRAILVDRRF